MELKKLIFNGVKWTTLNTVILAITAVLKISILTRYLDTSDFGLMAIVSFVLGLMSLFNDMGLTSSILHRSKISREEYSSLYWLNFIVSILLFLTTVFISPLIGNFYNEPRLSSLIILLGSNLIISAIGRQFKTIEQKNLEFKYISLIEILSSILSLGFAAILAVHGFGILSLIYSTILQYLISNFSFLFIGIRKYRIQCHFKFRETKPFLKIGFYQVGGQVMNYFNRDIDIILIGRFFPSEILGGYSLAKQLVSRPSQIVNPILISVASPALTRFQGDKSALKRNFLKLLSCISLINLPIYLGIILFASTILRVLYGPGFENLVVITRILSLYMFMRAIGNPIGSLVIVTGRTDLEMFWNTLTFIVIPVFVFFGSKFGIEETALSITFCMFILYVPSWKLLINRMIDVSLWEYIKGSVGMNVIKK